MVARNRTPNLSRDERETWLSRWAPYPAGVRRGPYAIPTAANLLATLAGLERLLAVIQDEDAPTTPAVHMPQFEPVPVPECVICAAAHNGRSAARAREDAAGVRKFSGIVSGHPHRTSER